MEDINIVDGLDSNADAAATSAAGVSDGGTVDEAYHLTVTSSGCVIRAGGPRGALWGLRTLAQLLFPDPSIITDSPSLSAIFHTARCSDGGGAVFRVSPDVLLAASNAESGAGVLGDCRDAELASEVELADWPEFGWRGCLLDCARHFMPVSYVARHIDALSRFKMNVLHWHLTDDQVSKSVFICRFSAYSAQHDCEADIPWHFLFTS